MPQAPRERTGLSEAIAAQIRAERSAARLTASEMAKRSGVPYSTYRKIEEETRSVDAEQLWRLCRVWGISLREFFARVEARLAAQADDGQHPPNG